MPRTRIRNRTSAVQLRKTPRRLRSRSQLARQCLAFIFTLHFEYTRARANVRRERTRHSKEEEEEEEEEREHLKVGERLAGAEAQETRARYE